MHGAYNVNCTANLYIILIQVFNLTAVKIYKLLTSQVMTQRSLVEGTEHFGTDVASVIYGESAVPCRHFFNSTFITTLRNAVLPASQKSFHPVKFPQISHCVLTSEGKAVDSLSAFANFWARLKEAGNSV